MRALAISPVGASAALVVAGVLAIGACGGGAQTEVVATPPPPVAPEPPSPQEIRDRVEKSTVRINGFVPALDSKAHGTAINLGDGQFLTNSHVVAGMSSIQVVYRGEKASATVMASNTCQDYAVLHVDHPPDGLVPAKLGSGEPEVGEEITAFGFGSSALNGGQSHQLLLKPGSVSATGLKSSFDPNLPKYRDLIEFDAMTRQGMSGGPVVNKDGEVIALITLGDIEKTDARYGIAIDEIKQELPALQAGKSPPSTGMELFSLSRETVYDLIGVWIPWKSLLFVVGVESGSPADNAKPGRIDEGDILLELEGERLRSIGDYCDVVESHEKGDTLTAGGIFDRGGDEVRLRLK